MSMVKRAVQALFEELRRQDDSKGSLMGLGDAGNGRTLLDGAYNLDAAMRAAIGAMREPTGAMANAGAGAVDDGETHGCLWKAENAWQAMISAALSEQGK